MSASNILGVLIQSRDHNLVRQKGNYPHATHVFDKQNNFKNTERDLNRVEADV